MTRSGVLGIVTMTLSSFAGVGVLACVIFRWWLPAIVIGAFLLCAMVAGTVLIRRADPEELAALAARNEGWLDAWARGMGKVAGGWEPRRLPRDRPPPRSNSERG
jgi:hypothetical protein